MIVAGPGSGKTRVLTHRIAHLVSDRGADPAACLAITFTRRAAAELRDRLTVLLPSGADRLPIHTFHSLGLAILREHGEVAGLRPGFRIAAEAERAELLERELDVSTRRAGALLREISRAKRTGSLADEEASRAADIYQRALEERNWVDFDDLVSRTVQALSGDPQLARMYSSRFLLIF
jgi:DNA helicase II / ATP-dependent DNA helicase PcrA